jgi:hypothetical protein
MLKTFEVGSIYSCRSAGDSDCVWRFVVTGRTDKTVTLIDDDLNTLRRRVSPSWDKTRETVMPFGSYSMAPVLHAE